MKNKGLIIGILVLLIAVGGYFAWQQKVGKPKENGKEVVKIGVILPLTGNAAFVGQPIKKGIETRLFAYEDNTKKNNVRIIYEDSKALPTMGKNALMKLNQQGVKVIIGPASSGVASVLIPEANKLKITLISPTASKQTLSKRDDFFFRNELSDGIGAKKQADLAIEQLHWDKMSIIFVNNEYGIGVKNNFEREYLLKGGTIVNSKGFDGKSNDFNTITQIVSKDSSNAIFIIAENQYVNIIKSLVEQGNEKPIYATPVFENKENLKQLGVSAEGIVYSYYGNYNPQSNDSIQQSFIKLYKSLYGSETPSYYAALGYESLDIILYALDLSEFKVGGLNDKLMEIQNFKSVTGNLSFDDNGDIIKPISIKTVKNGQFIFR